MIVHPYIDFAHYRIVYDEDDWLRLSPQDLIIMRELTRRPGELVRREHLLHSLYAGTRDGGPINAEKTLKVLMTNLRRISPWPIVNIYGEGYWIKDFPREARIEAAPQRRDAMAVTTNAPAVLTPLFKQDAADKWVSAATLSALGHVWSFETRHEQGNYQVLKDGQPAGFMATKLEVDAQGTLHAEWHTGYPLDPKTGTIGTPKFYRRVVKL